MAIKKLKLMLKPAFYIHVKKILMSKLLNFPTSYLYDNKRLLVHEQESPKILKNPKHKECFENGMSKIVRAP